MLSWKKEVRCETYALYGSYRYDCPSRCRLSKKDCREGFGLGLDGIAITEHDNKDYGFSMEKTVEENLDSSLEELESLSRRATWGILNGILAEESVLGDEL